MAKTYRVHEFAALAGVTAKTLHHYDRIGLLTPNRTEAGYRAYADTDLLRLQQIVALKFIGLSLRQIRTALEDGVLPLAEALDAQHAALRERREHIDRAIAALERARSAAAAPQSGATVLAHLIEILTTSDVDGLRKYFSDDVWERWRARNPSWPSQAWIDLYQEVHASLHEDPAGPHAQALARRAIALFEADTNGDPAVRAALRKAASDRDQFTMIVQTAMPGIDVERVGRFLAAAAWARWDAPDGKSYYTPTVRPRASEARISLLRAFEAVLDHQPESDRVQQLVSRWHAITEEESGGDSEIKAQILRAAARWREWPEGMRRWVAYTNDMPVDRWERVMTFIVDASGRTAA